jgi:hypothetical protein
MLQCYVLMCARSVDALLAPPRSQRPGQSPCSPHPKAGPDYNTTLHTVEKHSFTFWNPNRETQLWYFRCHCESKLLFMRSVGKAPNIFSYNCPILLTVTVISSMNHIQHESILFRSCTSATGGTSSVDEHKNMLPVIRGDSKFFSCLFYLYGWVHTQNQIHSEAKL